MFDSLLNITGLKILAEKMEKRNFDVQVVKFKTEALEAVKKLLPDGAEVMMGSSTTLKEIGFVDYLSSKNSKIISIQKTINEENDDEKRRDLRRLSVAADYFISSVNAVTKDGILLAVDASGSRVGAMPFAAKNIILVIGAQKIAEDIETAMQRIREYVFPKEDQRAKLAYGINSTFGKWVIIERELIPSRIKIVLVEEKLGF